MKKLFSCVFTLVFALVLHTGSVHASSVPEEYFFDIPITNLATESSYSRGLVTLNITAGGKSNESLITGTVSDKAIVTKVELTGSIKTANVSGVGNATWYVRHNGYNESVPVPGKTSKVSTTAFAGLPAKTTWSVWIEGASYSTVKGGSIRVYYTT